MRRTISLVAASAALLYSLLTASAVTIDTVPVGNPGNANDSTHFGAVPYTYRIGTYEVTNSQYAEFLNAKATADPLFLYNLNAGSDAHGGITRSGTSGSYVYAVKADMGDKPVNFVDWFSAVRFTNWLDNGQGSGDTETGAYTLTGDSPTPDNWQTVTRNAGAVWVLPSENEWYKAAYYQPVAQGGDTDSYWLYPTRGNVVPTVATANSMGAIANPGANIANYKNGAVWNGRSNVTTVGSAGPTSASFYGTFDQAGDVWEWTEQPYNNGSSRGARGGAWSSPSSGALSSAINGDGFGVFGSVSDIGFRVAYIPEPSTLALGLLGAVGAYCLARRRHK